MVQQISQSSLNLTQPHDCLFSAETKGEGAQTLVGRPHLVSYSTPWTAYGTLSVAMISVITTTVTNKELGPYVRHIDGVQGGTEEEIAHLPDGGKNGRLYKNATETRSQKLFPRHKAGEEQGRDCQ